MTFLKRSLWVLSSLVLASSTAAAADRPINSKIFGTRAIVACDPVGRQCGLAVISFPSGISGLVPYGRSDLAVASMSLPSPDDALAIIARIDAGETPQAAIDGVLAADPDGAIRQFAAVKLRPDGGVAVGQRSGAATSDHTCSVKGATYVVQANNQTTPRMCDVMARGFEKASGSFPQRLLASLQAGAKVGEDRNGDRSGVIRVWNTTASSALYSHLIADAATNASTTALKDLEVQLNRFQGTIAPPDSADLVALDRETARRVKHVLRGLGYYNGPLDGTWSAGAEQALGGFTWNNCFFDKPTVVVGDVRKIDGVLVNMMRDTDPDAFTRASPSTP